MQPTSLSLLNMARESQIDEEAWSQMNQVYSPLIQNWLLKLDVLGPDADDLAQDVMVIVMRKLPTFEHNGNTGAFRKWLRLVVVNCTRDFWKSKRIRPRTTDDTDFLNSLNQLSHDESELTQKWNLEHDLIVMQKMLEQVKPLFKDSTWEAFESTVLQEKNPESVAAELEISVSSVYAAKSRVLAKLRQFSRELLD